MIISIHQPQYIPWLNYFYKIKKSNIFIFLDNVEFQKNGIQNRNKLKTDKGSEWLTIPVQHKLGQKIFETKIDNKKNWKKKHWITIKNHYSKTRFFEWLKNDFELIYSKNWTYLSEINISIIELILNKLEIKTKLYKASDISVDYIKNNPSELILRMCKNFDTDVYLSGEGGKNYLVEKNFEKNQIKIKYLKPFQTMKYSQNYENLGFIENLSILDNLFNKGREIFE